MLNPEPITVHEANTWQATEHEGAETEGDLLEFKFSARINDGVYSLHNLQRQKTAV
jgi:hypothetical protein